MNRWHTSIDSLPKNSQGTKRIRFAHLDDSFHLSDDLLLGLLRSVVAVGGVGTPATVTVSGRWVTIENAVGVTLDGSAVLRVGRFSPGTDTVPAIVELDFDGTTPTDLGHALNTLANGTRCTLVLAAGPVLSARSYTDPATDEILLDQLAVALGQVVVMEGDLSTWPTPPAASVPLARITVNTGGVVVNHVYQTPPVLRSGGGVVSAAAAYEMTVADRVVLADAASGAFTVKLPDPAASEGVVLTVKRLNSGANAVTVGQFDSETIDGASSVSLAAQWDVARVTSDGVNWFRL